MSNWFFRITRIAGASFPIASSLVQMQSELDAHALDKRLSLLEDSISSIHQDIPQLCQLIYQELKTQNTAGITLNEAAYTQYGRPLAGLETQGLIEGRHALGKPYAKGFLLRDPVFILYMAEKHEEAQPMVELEGIVDDCQPGVSIDGIQLSQDLSVPVPVVRAIFRIYEAKGYGLLSNDVGTCNYRGEA